MTEAHSTGNERWRILIVEDEALLADEVQDRLIRMGHDVVAVVDTGADAIGAATQTRPDLVLMDIRIKGPMNGIQAGDRIFTDLGIPVIFASAHSDADTLQQAEITGQYGYIIKPYRESDLVMAIRLAMHRRQVEGAAVLINRDLFGDMHGALGRDEFLLHYQPIVDIDTGEVVKAEALLRWQHPDRGMISPLDFVPLLEESGLIHEVGEWIVDEAFSVSGRLATETGRTLPISVNMSAIQFESASHAVDWAAKLESIGDRGLLGIEVTESTLVGDPERVKEILRLFRSHGVHISIDDFGTGYSSLSYLKIFDIDYLKIDTAFTRGIISDASDRALTESIIDMADKLGLRTIAEGVETEEQRALLSELGCHLAQGYLFSRPLPEDDFIAFATR